MAVSQVAAARDGQDLVALVPADEHGAAPDGVHFRPPFAV
jgi:hypothetical protein